jgi:hypothetical protein
VNKFDALKTFQSWPPEWQRLCAECWIETGEVEPTQALRTLGERLESGRLIPTQGCTPIYRGEFGIIEREYLAKCHHETSTRRDAANMFLDRYPGRSVQAVEIKIRKMLDASGVMHVRY